MKTNIHGRQYTNLEGLLDLAHKDKLSSITTRILLLPHENDQGLAVAHAEVVTSRGTFQATGDASTDNVGEGIQIHLVRMAETRAIARALRWATNSANTAEEEVDASHPAAIFDQRMREGLPSNGGKKITGRQMGMILRLLREQNRKQDEFRSEVEQKFGTSIEELGVAQASEIIQELTA